MKFVVYLFLVNGSVFTHNGYNQFYEPEKQQSKDLIKGIFTDESGIKESKDGFGPENFSLQGLLATEASFRFIRVAHNSMSLFRNFALNHHNRNTLRTIKVYCFTIGVWTVNHANRTVLKIYLPAKKRPWMEGIISQIKNSCPLFNNSNTKFGINSVTMTG